jgi:hypothetical protein
VRRIFTPFVFALLFITLAASMSEAACYADYKAKQDRPLRLHYGVIELEDRACRRPEAAERIVSRRISADGWTLLTVMSTFDESGLEERRANAGEFYLRY